MEITALVKQASENIIRIQDEAIMEYMNAKKLTMEDLKNNCEAKVYPAKTEFYHNGDLILEFEKRIDFKINIKKYWK